MTAASRLRWATDVHLDHLLVRDAIAFADELFANLTDADIVVVTGDISSSVMLTNHLRIVDEASLRAHPCGVPWCFVLGNHDYYGGRIVDVRAGVRAFVATTGGRGVWLGGESRVVLLGEPRGTVLVGVDGWADARAGNPSTPVLMSDFTLIDDLADTIVSGGILNWRRGADRSALHAKLAALADAEGETLSAQLDAALADAATLRVVVATHVPPWSSAAWHEAALSGRDWQTYFVSVAIGRVIEAAARARPDVEFAVLCGHTHGVGFAAILPNLRVHTGRARYGHPEVQETFGLDARGLEVLFA